MRRTRIKVRIFGREFLGWWPHFLWVPEMPEQAEAFVPYHRLRWWFLLFPFFRGYVKTGDKD